jgi:regulator of protease activity HflC (stomatin/prohibitin superfamily)
MGKPEWRGDRPAEDPDKTKSWGWVTAKPSEYLVHVRRGRVLPSSGQGASCFKWPRDAVSIVPTSLQKLSFKADQVTVERVGVEVVGLAVYRVAEPLLAYRVVNFSFPERAQQKLEETLTAMFVGAVRRLVANLTVEDCLQRRKDAIAAELLREVAPVVGGRGRPDDHTREGWGIVIDTMEIQEVRVLSEKVFASMQAPYRAALDQKAKEAQLQTEAVVRERQAQLQMADALRAHENAVAEARAEEASHEHRVKMERLRAERRRAEVAVEVELRAVESESSLKAHLQAAQAERAHAEAELVKAEAQARVWTAQKLPELAAAVGQRIGEVKIHQWGGDGNPFGTIAAAVESLISLTRPKS